jgi:hypothetical protein
LADSARSGQPNDPATSNWLGEIDDSLLAKLIKCGLAEPRSNPEPEKPEESVTVAEMVSGYISSRMGIRSTVDVTRTYAIDSILEKIYVLSNRALEEMLEISENDKEETFNNFMVVLDAPKSNKQN